MSDAHETVLKALGRDRQLITPLDLFRASDFRTAILSGAANYTSGQSIYSVVASSIVRLRPLDISMHSRETTHMTVLFRDGGISGAIFAGPYTINPTSQRIVKYDELGGRFALSGVYAVVISGTFVTGIDVTVGFVLEPDPTAAGGYLE